MSEKEYQAYEGAEPFVFVSYAHADTALVMPLIRELQDRGFRVWYDAGIHAGLRWNKVIVEHLNKSQCVLCLLSGRYVASDNCKQELYYAKKQRKNLLIGHLERFAVPAELDMELVLLHQEYADHYQSQSAFLDKLTLSPVLQSCREEKSGQEPDGDAQWLLGKEAMNGKSWAKNDLPDAPETQEDNRQEPESFFEYAMELMKRGNPREAVGWLRRAAEMGHARAQCNLGLCLLQGRGVDANPTQALEWFSAAGAQGDAVAQFHTGLSYDKGLGTPPDAAEALRWYEMAAAQGHARAQCLAAGCYAAGRGVQQDLARALEWYVRSADQGDSDALFNAGFFFDRGRGTAPDPARAVRYYSLAAGKDPRAMFNLGKCLEAGRGTAMNLSGAVELYTTAAGMGHHAAQHRLSQLYREGIGVKKDRRKADFWLKKSQER